MSGRFQRLVAVHGGLWFDDPWYRRSWFVWPQALALVLAVWLVGSGWAPTAPEPNGDWAKPVPSAMTRNEWMALRNQAQSDEGAFARLKGYADQNDPGAQTAVGELLDPLSSARSKILPANGKDAVSWWKKAAEQGDPIAQFDMAYALLNADLYGVEKNESGIIPWAEKSAAQGFAPADRLLGFCYMHGRGTTADPNRGFRLLSSAAARGEPDAQWMLGVAYELAQGTPADPKKGFEWFQKSAASGNAAGMNNLGVAYEKGGGVDKDIEQARSWYKRAAAAGSKEAPGNLSRLPAPVQVNPVQ